MPCYCPSTMPTDARGPPCHGQRDKRKDCRRLCRSCTLLFLNAPIILVPLFQLSSQHPLDYSRSQTFDGNYPKNMQLSSKEISTYHRLHLASFIFATAVVVVGIVKIAVAGRVYARVDVMAITMVGCMLQVYMGFVDCTYFSPSRLWSSCCTWSSLGAQDSSVGRVC